MAFSYYRAVTLDESKCGTADSTDFPVTFTGTYAYLATVANGGLVQNANGYDIGFYSDSALTTKLDWEMVTYTAATGFLEAHFRVGTLSSSTNGVVYLAYGDSGISTFQGNVTGTWNSAFESVQHFPDGTTLTLLDSTSNDRDGAATNAAITASTGQIDGGASFNGTNQSMKNGGSAYPTGALTASIWMKFTTESNLFAFCRVGDSASTYSWMMEVYLGRIYWDGSGTGTPWAWQFYDAGWNDGNWHLVHGTFDPSTKAELYVDGVSQNSSTSSIPASLYGTSADVYAGSGALFNRSFFAGDLDEARISSAVRSASWVTAEYNNQYSPSTFYTMGSQVAVGGAFLAAKNPIPRQAVNRAATY
jgi:hypothetical protein